MGNHIGVVSPVFRMTGKRSPGLRFVALGYTLSEWRSQKDYAPVVHTNGSFSSPLGLGF